MRKNKTNNTQETRGSNGEAKEPSLGWKGEKKRIKESEWYQLRYMQPQGCRETWENDIRGDNLSLKKDGDVVARDPRGALNHAPSRYAPRKRKREGEIQARNG